MQNLLAKIQKFEFESRIFISFGIVIFICALSFSVFSHTPASAVMLGQIMGISAEKSLSLGFLTAALLMVVASLLRIWSGSVLTSKRMMSFKVKVDELCLSGPYFVVRNPIYLADLIAFCGFVLCLPPIGILLPCLLFLHYTQLISYEEISLQKQFGGKYVEYINRIPCLIPNLKSLLNLARALKEFKINRDGFRHNALYLLFIPGFVLASFTGKLLWAIVLGVPAVVDWAVVHTKIGTEKKRGNTVAEKKVFKDVLYAMCWEDPQIDRIAFQITPDDVVFSITSGGCNVLTFLIDNPLKVIALDINPHQNYLLDLKIAAFRELPHQKLLEFFGVRKSTSRLRLYRRLRPLLFKDSARYWDGQPQKINKGIIHCGCYEGYMRLLKKIIVTLSMKQKLVKAFFETQDSVQRKKLFHERWENIWWKILTRVMLSRTLNSLLFDKQFFAYLDENFSFGKHFAKKAERALVELPVKENYFLSYILLGRFRSEEYLPHYLREENYHLIRSRLDRIEIVTDSCQHYFSTLADSSISKFNFSNIFEWMSPEVFANLLKETIRVAKNRSILTYRNLLVFREHPISLEANIRSRSELAESLRVRDLSFIYNNYVVEEIHKGKNP